MRKKDIIVFGQYLKVSPIVLLLLFEALNTPTNKLYNTSMRDATQWVNLQHFVQKRVVKITLWISNYLILFTVPIAKILSVKNARA